MKLKNRKSKTKKINYVYDLLSIGDATLDTFIKLNETNVSCQINKNKRLLCLNYADKIPVQDLFYSIGGNAANNVVGAKKLGLKCIIYSELGDDETAKQVLLDFKKNKIDTKYIYKQKKVKTNYSVILKYFADRTILTYHDKRKYNFPKKIKASKYIYLTSMSEGSEKIYKDIIAYAEKYNSKICFGPGSYQRKRGLNRLKIILKNSYLYISNKEEAQDIFNFKKKKGEKEILFLKKLMKHIFSYGIKIVIITDGRNGVYAYDGNDYYYLKIIKSIKAKYPTGAGDAFSTGFIAALIKRKNIMEALRWGTFNASGVIQKMGPHYGLLNKMEMNNYCHKYSKLSPQII